MIKYNAVTRLYKLRWSSIEMMAWLLISAVFIWSYGWLIIKKDFNNLTFDSNYVFTERL